MSTLVELVNQAAEIEKMLIESGGEITEHIQEALSTNQANLPAKVDSYKFVIDKLDSSVEFYKEKAKFYSNLAKGIDSAKERVKDNLRFSMSLLGTDELIGEDIRFKLTKSKPKLIIDNEAIIPDDYKIQIFVKELDKDKLRSDLVTAEIPGARLEESFSLKSYANRKQ